MLAGTAVVLNDTLYDLMVALNEEGLTLVLYRDDVPLWLRVKTFIAPAVMPAPHILTAYLGSATGELILPPVLQRSSDYYGFDIGAAIVFENPSWVYAASQDYV